MRFMYDYNESPNVEEIVEIEASPVWDKEIEGHEDCPDYYMVTIYKAGWHTASEESKEFYEICGEYRLDGTEVTYRAAVANYNAIAEQLLVKGYCKASDFVNFDFD